MPAGAAPPTGRLLALLATLALVPVLALTACGAPHHTATSATTTATARPQPATTSPARTPSAARLPPTDPLTGRPGQPRPVVAVKVDNVYVGSRDGLNQADVVYVEEVEGGLTRLLAVFSSQTPARVGPVRSARESDLQLLAEYGKVALAFSGANTGVLASVAKANVRDDSFDKTPGFYQLDRTRPSPYQFLVDVGQLVRQAPGVVARDVGFRFGAAPVTVRPAPAVRSATVHYPGSSISVHAAGAGWQIFRDGAALTLREGGVVSAENILIQYVQLAGTKYVDHNGNGTPVTVTVGTGKAVLLRAGHLYNGTWTRRAASLPTTWTAAGGGPLRLAAGRTWVLLVPTGVPIQTS